LAALGWCLGPPSVGGLFQFGTKRAMSLIEPQGCSPTLQCLDFGTARMS
jgi:hypothetical protein